MQKKPLIITAVLLITIVGAAVYVSASSSDDQARQDMAARPIADAAIPPAPADMAAQPAMTTQPAPAAPAPTPANKPAASAGAYVDYSQAAFEATSGTRLVFFHAPWCPQCRALEADIKQDGVPSGVTIFKVDYDTNQALRKKYGVTIQTTVVLVDSNGNLAKRYVAYQSPTLDAVKADLL